MRPFHALCLLLTLPLSSAAAPLPRFLAPNAIWNVDVSQAPLRANSAAMTSHLAALSPHGWGDTRDFDFLIDFSFYVMHADASTPIRTVVAWPDTNTYYSPDCEAPGTGFPVPGYGGIEGTDPLAFACSAGDDDCHLLVVDDTAKVLHESYATNAADATGVHATCAVRWDLKRVYPRNGRGEHCTSADAAGFPIAPLLFNADEVWAAAQARGDLGHAIRFILGNNRMARHKYVHPASHGTLATSDTDANAVPYGSRLRLKATFDVDGFSQGNEAKRAILHTLQKYGMFLSDGGGVPLTAESDALTTHKWPELGITAQSLYGIHPTDFEVVEAGDPIAVTYDCVRTPEDFLFIDGYDY